jgi:hypothetical protein
MYRAVDLSSRRPSNLSESKGENPVEVVVVATPIQQAWQEDCIFPPLQEPVRMKDIFSVCVFYIMHVLELLKQL